MRHLVLGILILMCLPAIAADLEHARPEAVGMSSERLERIKTYMQQYVDDNKLAGITMVVVRRGKIVFQKTVGKLNMDTGAPLRDDSLFRIYSMTKPIVTTAAMMLHEEGKFLLDDPVARYLPAFRDVKVLVNGLEVEQSHPFTIRELMSHTAGLTYGHGDTVVDLAYREAGVLDSKNLEEMVEKLGKIPLLYQPGTRWHYSVSADVLGRLIEVISGMSLDDFLEQRLFKPLGMNDTFFQVPADKLARFGTNHFRNEDGVLSVRDRPESSRFTRKVTFFSGGGGLVSTTMDYLKYSQMMLNGGELNGLRLLSPKTVELMTINHLPEGTNSGFGERPDLEAHNGFGLGFGVLTEHPLTTLGSKGVYYWGGISSTIFWIDPEQELIAIFMAQMWESPYPLRKEIRNMVYQAVVD